MANHKNSEIFSPEVNQFNETTDLYFSSSETEMWVETFSKVVGEQCYDHNSRTIFINQILSKSINLK